jgi:hypothetical protein
MKSSPLPLLIAGAGAAASSFFAYFISDIALLLFGAADPRTERVVMLGLLFCQLGFVALLAHCIRRHHYAGLRRRHPCTLPGAPVAQ